MKDGNLTVYKASREANEKKLVRNAFKDGDMYFNYGDVFYLDSDYFVYFHDRIGDTFRWESVPFSALSASSSLLRLPLMTGWEIFLGEGEKCEN